MVECPFCLRSLEPIEVPDHKDLCPTWDIETPMPHDYVMLMDKTKRPSKVNETNRVNDYVDDINDSPEDGPIPRDRYVDNKLLTVLMIALVIVITLMAVLV